MVRILLSIVVFLFSFTGVAMSANGTYESIGDNKVLFLFKAVLFVVIAVFAIRNYIDWNIEEED